MWHTIPLLLFLLYIPGFDAPHCSTKKIRKQPHGLLAWKHVGTPLRVAPFSDVYSWVVFSTYQLQLVSLLDKKQHQHPRVPQNLSWQGCTKKIKYISIPFGNSTINLPNHHFGIFLVSMLIFRGVQLMDDCQENQISTSRSYRGITGWRFFNAINKNICQNAKRTQKKTYIGSKWPHAWGNVG